MPPPPPNYRVCYATVGQQTTSMQLTEFSFSMTIFSVNEERYTHAPTLPLKDYPDVIIQTPNGRKQRTKKVKTSKVPQSDIEVNLSRRMIIVVYI